MKKTTVALLNLLMIFGVLMILTLLGIAARMKGSMSLLQTMWVSLLLLQNILEITAIPLLKTVLREEDTAAGEKRIGNPF